MNDIIKRQHQIAKAIYRDWGGCFSWNTSISREMVVIERPSSPADLLAADLDLGGFNIPPIGLWNLPIWDSYWQDGEAFQSGDDVNKLICEMVEDAKEQYLNQNKNWNLLWEKSGLIAEGVASDAFANFHREIDYHLRALREIGYLESIAGSKGIGQTPVVAIWVSFMEPTGHLEMSYRDSEGKHQVIRQEQRVEGFEKRRWRFSVEAVSDRITPAGEKFIVEGERIESARLDTNPQQLSKVKRLFSALLSAYTMVTLRRMVRFEMGENLEAIVGKGRQEDVCFELIEWAERYGRLDELIESAYQQNPDNPELRDFAQGYFGKI